MNMKMHNNGRFDHLVRLILCIAVFLLGNSPSDARRNVNKGADKASTFASSKKKCTENDHYCVLDLPSSATEDQIKKQFRKLAKVYHPDKNLENREAAEAQFVLISKAYEILSDEQKRREYDYERRYGGSQHRHTAAGGFHDDFDDIVRSFQTMFGEEFSHQGGGFQSRQQQQQQQFQRFQQRARGRASTHNNYQQQQHQQQYYDSRHPNQKVYFAQRGPDGRTYYYEQNTQSHRQFTQGNVEEEEDFDPFAYLFDQTFRNRHTSKPFYWYQDFTPTSMWAKFLWQIGYYIFLLYVMLSIFACCSGPNPTATPPQRPMRLTSEKDENGDDNQSKQADQGSRNSIEPKASKPKVSNPLLYPLPVITKKEMVETRGMIFVIASSLDMEMLLRRCRKVFSKDPVLFRRYHVHQEQPQHHEETKESIAIMTKYEKIKMLEQLFCLWTSRSQRLHTSDGSLTTASNTTNSATNIQEQLTMQWRVIAVSKTGSKFAIFNAPVSAITLLLSLKQQIGAEKATGESYDLIIDAKAEEQQKKQVENMIGTSFDEWLSRLIQGLEPWQSVSGS